jgi:signal transduction histidine kinase
VPPSREDGGAITLTVDQWRDAEGRRFGEVIVEDNGPGVPEDQQPDLFKRFFRGDGQSVEGGAGLGLAIVHDIVVLHGGSVHYENAPEGGARFIVRIPLKTETPPATATSSST